MTTARLTRQRTGTSSIGSIDRSSIETQNRFAVATRKPRATPHTHTVKQLVRPLRQVLNLHLDVRGHQTRENQAPFTAKRNFEISMVRAMPSRVKRYISGTSKAKRTIYGHVMHTATLGLPGPSARLEREKTPGKRLRKTPQVQLPGHLGQPLRHHRFRPASSCGRCGPLVRQPHEMALR